MLDMGSRRSAAFRCLCGHRYYPRHWAEDSVPPLPAAVVRTKHSFHRPSVASRGEAAQVTKWRDVVWDGMLRVFERAGRHRYKQ